LTPVPKRHDKTTNAIVPNAGCGPLFLLATQSLERIGRGEPIAE
jgi:hypothetical protein